MIGIRTEFCIASDLMISILINRTEKQHLLDLLYAKVYSKMDECNEPALGS